MIRKNIPAVIVFFILLRVHAQSPNQFTSGSDSTGNGSNTYQQNNNHGSINNNNSVNTDQSKNYTVTTNGNGNTTIINNNTTVINSETHTGQGHGRDNKGNSQGGNKPADLCSTKGFTQEEFNKTYNLVKSKPNESVRVSTIKQAARGRLVSADHCTKLIGLLTVAAHRLEVAKYLYDYTCEKQNYYLVGGAIGIADYERQFNDFLNTKDLSNPKPVYEDDRDRNRNNGGRYYDSHSQGRHRTENSFTWQQFEDLKQSVNSQSFSNTKVSIIEQAVQSRKLTTNQNIDLLQLFSFEQDKLSMAKYLYDYTVDRENYYKVSSVFSYSTSVDELNKYLKNK